MPCQARSGVRIKPPVFEEDFAEVWLGDERAKVEVVTRSSLPEVRYLVERVEGAQPFEVKAQELTNFGSHDPESKQQMFKRQEFEKLEELLKEEDCTIEKMTGDGNCLSRAVARQIYGNQEQYQRVREETVDYIISNKDYFSWFETEIDERLTEQLFNRSWGGHLEIEAMSELYNVGILIWELSQSGQLVAPFDNRALAASKGLRILYLTRHRKTHYNVVIWKNRELPLIRTEGLSRGSEIKDARVPRRLSTESRNEGENNHGTALGKKYLIAERQVE